MIKHCPISARLLCGLRGQDSRLHSKKTHRSNQSYGIYPASVGNLRRAKAVQAHVTRYQARLSNDPATSTSSHCGRIQVLLTDSCQACVGGHGLISASGLDGADHARPHALDVPCRSIEGSGNSISWTCSLLRPGATCRTSANDWGATVRRAATLCRVADQTCTGAQAGCTTSTFGFPSSISLSVPVPSSISLSLSLDKTNYMPCFTTGMPWLCSCLRGCLSRLKLVQGIC